ncbi:MAG: mycothione reductase [Frankia sp.]
MALTDFDLVIVGSGSGNALITPDFDDRSVALVEAGAFGGTCLNHGCIPTKMLVYTAQVAQTVRQAARFGLDAHLDDVRWTDIRDRIFNRIDPTSMGGKRDRQESKSITVIAGTAAFNGERSLLVNGVDTLTARQMVIATGARPIVPDVVSASGVPFHTSDTMMRIDRLPATLVILGGGYVAAEFAHIFSGLGVAVRVVTRGPGLLRALDSDLSARFTAQAADRWELHLSADVTAVRGNRDRVELTLADGATVAGDLLLVATGRQPNSDRLNLPAAGVEVHPSGRIKVDQFGRTTAPNTWALGDVSSGYQLKHVANAEARTVGHNLTHPGDPRPLRHRFVPSAVFTSPQIASVGATGQQLRAGGRPFVTATQAYSDTAYGWAAEDHDGFCRLYADPRTGLLLGAHLMGLEASNIIQPLIQAMTLDQPVAQVARDQFWIHPALSEVVENALLKLGL